jgi:hypothetical protein
VRCWWRKQPSKWATISMVEAGPVSFVFSFDFVFLSFSIQIKSHFKFKFFNLFRHSFFYAQPEKEDAFHMQHNIKEK